MARFSRELSYGTAEIYTKESDTLGVGSYGKVCKAKCGQLPCAAKLLHDTMFGTNDTGIYRFLERFEQECQFLRSIKHPNIVQFLNTYRDPRSQRLVLLMELMDESLTRFLERSTGPLPYHTQLNICQDVALALAYLHSNDIIHRDLSSNNVLLIGEGSRAKVTDFGMSKLKGMNPCMTPLTMCPGTLAYMPPEALVTPPQYSSKLDCFSHGVLTIQIATRQFPNPGDANQYIEDPRYPTGRVLIQFPETKRRKKQIDLVAPDHPLLPFALHCLKDRDTERPSANELCERLATLKREPRYTQSVEQFREQNISLQTLQQQILDKDSQLQHQISKLDRAKIELHECQQKLETAKQEKESELNQCRATFQRQLQEREDELERAKEQYEELNAKETMLEQVITKQTEIERLHKENQQKQELTNKPQNDNTTNHKIQSWPTNPVKLTWRQGTPAPDYMAFTGGASVVHNNIAYFSHGREVSSYTLPADKWTKLPKCEYKRFSLAIVNDKLTTLGGWKDNTTNTLLCLLQERKWEQLLPPMTTARERPAAITTPTHLVVAGGQTEENSSFFLIELNTVEVLDLNTLQWSSASSLPQALRHPHMTLCGGYLYLSENNTIFSSSVEELLKSCKPPSTNSSDGGSVWTRLTDIPVPYWTSLVTLREHVLAIGGSEERSGVNPTGAIHCYDRSTNSWSVIGEMPTPRSHTLTVVLPSNELIVVGGDKGKNYCKITETAFTD